MGDFVIQMLKKTFTSEMEKAFKYYSIISVWNGFSLSEREIQLIAYMSVKGTISYKTSKEDFSRMFSSSPSTVNNMISKLKATGLIVKTTGGKYEVNPKIALDFSRDVVLGIKLFNKEGKGDK